MDALAASARYEAAAQACVATLQQAQRDMQIVEEDIGRYLREAAQYRQQAADLAAEGAQEGDSI